MATEILKEFETETQLNVEIFITKFSEKVLRKTLSTSYAAFSFKTFTNFP